MSLTSVAAPIWNEIAKAEKLKTEWAKRAFALSPDEMTALENKEYGDLAKRVPPSVASAYLDVKPLYLERKAISHHLRNRPDLRSALPEVTSLKEAIALASMDRPLSPREMSQLEQLLQAETT